VYILSITTWQTKLRPKALCTIESSVLSPPKSPLSILSPQQQENTIPAKHANPHLHLQVCWDDDNGAAPRLLKQTTRLNRKCLARNLATR